MRVYLLVSASSAFGNGMAIRYGHVSQCIYKIYQPKGLSVPKKVVSVNWTNFVGAVNELKSLVSKLDEEKIEGKTASKGVRWPFNPPAAPHFWGN